MKRSKNNFLPILNRNKTSKNLKNETILNYKLSYEKFRLIGELSNRYYIFNFPFYRNRENETHIRIRKQVQVVFFQDKIAQVFDSWIFIKIKSRKNSCPQIR